jgi:CO/xanthine dehydrogenase FAD-binding subunit
VEVVDLQALELKQIAHKGNILSLGAMVTLQECLGIDGFPEALKRAIRHECTYNLRQVASVAGTLVAADGRSPFTTTMLALDAFLTLQPSEEQISLGDLLPRRAERLEGRLITSLNLPTNAILAYEYVARTPADLPIVCAAVGRWPSGRTRVALGGYGLSPTLAMDGPQFEGADLAAENAYLKAGDLWASAEYRSQVAGVLVRRCLEQTSAV